MKKGGSNFRIISDNVRIVQVGFGEIIFNSNENRTFNHILHGTVMLFSKARPDASSNSPKFFRKHRTGEHFGEKVQFGKDELESARCISIDCYLLQLDMKPFYHAFSGHFKYEELKD
jgi:hypothetical protein